MRRKLPAVSAPSGVRLLASCTSSVSCLCIEARTSTTHGWCDLWPIEQQTRHWVRQPIASRPAPTSCSSPGLPAVLGARPGPHRSGRPHAEGDRANQHGPGVLPENAAQGQQSRPSPDPYRREYSDGPPPQPPRSRGPWSQAVHRTPRCARKYAPPPWAAPASSTAGTRLAGPPRYASSRLWRRCRAQPIRAGATAAANECARPRGRRGSGLTSGTPGQRARKLPQPAGTRRNHGPGRLNAWASSQRARSHQLPCSSTSS